MYLPFVLILLAAPYQSPFCGPEGGSTAWACGAWPSLKPPELGRAGTATADPDTGNRVLRVTEAGSFGEDRGTAFKVFDAGWRPAWNANSTRFAVVPWRPGSVRHAAYWLGFDGPEMRLTKETGTVPGDFSDFQWDPSEPDLLVGLADGVAKSYHVQRHKFETIFDPAKTHWRGQPWISAWGGDRVCVAEGPQDEGHRLVCYDRRRKTSQVIDLREQTLDGKPLPVRFRGESAALPRSAGIHTITLAPDGRYLAIDSHGNTVCGTPGLPNYASTALFIDLDGGAGYEWNVSCGSTHWAYGYDSVMMQSTSPKWTPKDNNGPCNSDSRGVARRRTDADIDSSLAILQPCRAFDPATWDVNVHLTWANNAPGNSAPVVIATVSGHAGAGMLWNEIAAAETTAAPYSGRLWRFAQTWNDPVSSQCRFLDYSSPSVSPNGRWVLFPSNWRGQTGKDGVCAGGGRTDVFVFELR